MEIGELKRYYCAVLSENILNTSMEVANRHHMSSEVVILDHQWR